MTLLYKSDPARAGEWAGLVSHKAPGLDFRVWPEVGDPREVRYLATCVPDDTVMEQFPNLELLFATEAVPGRFDASILPETLPVVGIIEPGMGDAMVEAVAMSVLALHRDLVPYIAQQRARHWEALRIWPASARRVGVLGLGVTGEAVCRKLAGFGFEVAGWSRSRHEIEGIDCHAGPEEMPAFLARTDILVRLPPTTEAAQGMPDAELFAQLPRGAMLASAGHGDRLDRDALVAALDGGRLSAAVLDVTSPESLPAGHPLWSHPRVLITPHAASMPEPEAAVDAILETLRRHRAGEPLPGRIDRRRAA